MFLGFLSGFLASLLGWQINSVSIQIGIDRRRRSAFLVGAGAVFGDLVFIYLAFKGTVPILQHPEAWFYLKWIGILTVFGMALRILLKKPNAAVDPKQRSRGAKRFFFLGFVIVTTNPAVFLLWIGIISFIMTRFPPEYPKLFHREFVGGFLIGGLLWFGILTSSLIPIFRKWDNRWLIVLSRVTALVLIIAGVILVF